MSGNWFPGVKRGDGGQDRGDSSRRTGEFLSASVFIALAICLLAVVVKCSILQLQQHEIWTARQTLAQTQDRWTTAQRGRIIDRNGEVLAEDLLTFRVAIDPLSASRVRFRDSSIEPLSHTVTRVLDLPHLRLDHPREVIEERILEICRQNAALLEKDASDRDGTPIQYLPIGVVDGGVEEVQLLEATSQLHSYFRRRVVCGLEPVVERRYPFGSRGTLVIGELRGDRQIGLHGIELASNEALRERRGLIRELKDRNGRRLRSGVEEIPRFQGKDVSLTIGIHEQTVLETILEETYFKTGSRSVSGIVMDPSNGEVIAIGTYPGLLRGELQQLFNERRPQDALPKMLQPLHLSMEPGSVVKPLILTAALQQGIGLEDPVAVTHKSQTLTIGGRRRTFHDSHLLRDRTVRGVIVESSNIGIVQIGQKLGIKKVFNCFDSFRLGRRTGIDLIGEETGRIRPVREWTARFTLASTSYGYEMMVTPIQMITAYCAIANGGVTVTPHLRRVEGTQQPPQQRILPEWVAAQTRGVLRQVMEEGTGRTVKERIGLAGKTGTAKMNIDGEYVDGKYISSFIGFAPWDAPTHIAMVVVEEPDPSRGYYASKTAAPAVRDLLTSILREPGNIVQEALELGVPVDRLRGGVDARMGEAGQFREDLPRRIDPKPRADSLSSPGGRGQGGEPGAWDHED